MASFRLLWFTVPERLGTMNQWVKNQVPLTIKGSRICQNIDELLLSSPFCFPILWLPRSMRQALIVFTIFVPPGLIGGLKHITKSSLDIDTVCLICGLPTNDRRQNETTNWSSFFVIPSNILPT